MKVEFQLSNQLFIRFHDLQILTLEFFHSNGQLLELILCQDISLSQGNDFRFEISFPLHSIFAIQPNL